MDKLTQYENNFHAVSRREPCKICGKPDYCWRSNDHSAHGCMRIQGGVEKRDKTGTIYWLYHSETLTEKEIPPSTPIRNQGVLRASDDILHRVYFQFLKLLTLEEQHLHNLHSVRRLPKTEIEMRGYRSSPLRDRARILKPLVNQFGADLIRTVPGFIERQGAYGSYFTFCGSPGLLIPVVSLERKIVALKIRRDVIEDDQPRYSYFSSKKYGGPSPGARVHVPIHLKRGDRIGVTEGELKADIATMNTGELYLSVPGVKTWSMCIPIVDQIQPKTVVVAFDRDSWTNSDVARSIRSLVEALKQKKYGVELWTK